MFQRIRQENVAQKTRKVHGNGWLDDLTKKQQPMLWGMVAWIWDDHTP